MTKYRYSQYLNEDSVKKIFREYKIASISKQTGINKSTLKNYKYEKIPYKLMPVGILKELTKVSRTRKKGQKNEN